MMHLRRSLASFRAPLAGGVPEGRTGLLAALWLALVAVAVLGRLWRPEWNGQPLWNVTPLSGLAVVAGAVFGRRLPLAASVPVVALAVSNLAEPGYGSVAMAVAVFAATAWPVVLGGVARRGWLGVLCGGAAASLGFFLITNAAHWLLMNDYPRDAGGLAACYVAALPFYRPVGDLFWTAALAAVASVTRRIADVVESGDLPVAPVPVPAESPRSGPSDRHPDRTA